MTARVTLRRAASREAIKPGEWAAIDEPEFRHVWKAIIACPECGFESSIRTHEVAADGTISPSLVCPASGCSWHVWGRLDGWEP